MKILKPGGRLPLGVRSSVTAESSYAGFEVMKSHSSHGFPGGRAQFFREALQITFGLSDDFITKSKISLSDAAKLKRINTNELKEMGALMAEGANHKLTFKKAPSMLKSGITADGKGNLEIMTKRGLNTSNKSLVIHEMLEMDQMMMRRGEARAFGSHQNRTVIAEETRFARALGSKTRKAQLHLRTYDYSKTQDDKYREGLERFGLIKPATKAHRQKRIDKIFEGMDEAIATVAKSRPPEYYEGILRQLRAQRQGIIGKQSTSKIRDQMSRNPSMPFTKRRLGGNYTVNKSRYIPKN